MIIETDIFTFVNEKIGKADRLAPEDIQLFISVNGHDCSVTGFTWHEKPGTVPWVELDWEFPEGEE